MENVELSNCIYEHIKDTFYYGLFGDFRLVIDKSTGFFNATKLCDQGGKNLFNWKRLEKSKRMVEYYQRNCPSDLKGNFLYEVKGANKDKTDRQFTGTYVPQELILEIASWVSIEFYDKCNKIILNYFVNEFKKMNKSALEEKIKQVEQLEEQMKKLTLKHEEVVAVKDDKIDQLLNYVRSLPNLILRSKTEHRFPKTRPNKNDSFCLSATTTSTILITPSEHKTITLSAS